VEFLKENILLIALALGSGIMLLLPGFKKNAGGAANLSPTEAVNLINRNHALVLDVREATEFSTGHIVDAKNIPLNALPERLNELKNTKTNRFWCIASVACAAQKPVRFYARQSLRRSIICRAALKHGQPPSCRW